jgi:hypothetical protein
MSFESGNWVRHKAWGDLCGGDVKIISTLDPKFFQQKIPVDVLKKF